jgi:hypothetical protein
MEGPEPLPLSVTEEQLFAIIGRLHVENMVLRARLAERLSPAVELYGDPAPAPHGESPAHDQPR